MVLEHVNMVVMCQSVTQHFTTARRHILGGGDIWEYLKLSVAREVVPVIVVIVQALP